MSKDPGFNPTLYDIILVQHIKIGLGFIKRQAMSNITYALTFGQVNLKNTRTLVLTNTNQHVKYKSVVINSSQDNEQKLLGMQKVSVFIYRLTDPIYR